MKKEITTQLRNELLLGEWETIGKVIDRLLAGDKNTEIPLFLQGEKDLKAAKEDVQAFCKHKTLELQTRKESEEKRNKERTENEERVQREKLLLDDEKQKKIREYIEKRCLEQQTQKQEDQSKHKDIGEPLLEDKRFFIIEKAKKLERDRNLLTLKLRKKEELIRKRHEETMKKQQETKEQAVEEWLRNKALQEKERKMKEKVQEIERQRTFEHSMYLRKLEHEKRLISKKVKEKIRLRQLNSGQGKIQRADTSMTEVEPIIFHSDKTYQSSKIGFPHSDILKKDRSYDFKLRPQLKLLTDIYGENTR